MKTSEISDNISKGHLAKTLSQLKGFEKQKVRDEQYSTPGEVAAELLWIALLQGDIKDKKIADLGAGTGILGIGAALLGASKIILVEKDESAIKISKQNTANAGIIAEFVNTTVQEFKEKTDTVIMNPPFGTKQEHADRIFLDKAFQTAPIVYSIHKTSTEEFIQKYASSKGYKTTHIIRTKLIIPYTQLFHKKPKKEIKITIFRLIQLSAEPLAKE